MTKLDRQLEKIIQDGVDWAEWASDGSEESKKIVSQIKQSILKAIEEEVKIKIWHGVEFQETPNNPTASSIYKLGFDRTMSVIKEVLK